MEEVRLCVAGASGKMGRAVASVALGMESIELVGGLEGPQSKHIGADLGALAGSEKLGVLVDSDRKKAIANANVIIDFSAPAAIKDTLSAAQSARCAMVIGTTGFDANQEAAIAEAAKSIAIVKSGNMSLGVNLLTALVEQAAASLSADYDIEIYEAHHRRKVDAPSGTALMLGEAAARGREIEFQSAPQGRAGVREEGAIGFSVFRGGGVIGEHKVSFAAEREMITLSHSAFDRSLFAEGALSAAKWVIGQRSGLYSMRDVLGLEAKRLEQQG